MRVFALRTAWPLDRRATLSLTLLLLLVCGVDFFSRVWVNPDLTSRVVKVAAVQEMPPIVATEQALAMVRGWLPTAFGGSGVVEKQLKLIGVLGPPGRPTAIIGLGAGPQVSQFVSLTVGGTIEGWQVDKIDRKSTTLSRAGETKVIEVFPSPTTGVQ